MTENELRQKYVKTAIGYLGVAEYTDGHKEILAWYNKQDPLPRGVKMVGSYDWCAAFDTAMAVKAGLIDIIPGECSCNRQIALWKAMGRWQENDAYIPKSGDLIYYDWQDSGKADNVGEADHVGIVVSVSGNTIKVIEGNKGDKVAYRTLSVDGRYIRGYGLPDFASKATVTESPSSKDIVYTVQKGDTLSGIAAKYGTTYQALAAYNNIADANKISVGQEIKIPGGGSTSSSEGASSGSSTSSAPTYKVGNVYTLQVELKVRTGPGTNYSAKTHNQLTTDGQGHDTDKDGALDKGTKVTCLELRTVGSDIWMRIPSGWIAAYYHGSVYVK